MSEFFTSERKLSGIVEENFKIVRILKRLGIMPGFGEKSVRDVCVKYNISYQLFLTIANMTTYKRFEPDQDFLKNLPTLQLVNYLRSSHHEFIFKDIPLVEKSIYEIAESKDFANSHSSVFINFFKEYKFELLSHFEYEDGIVFPYISSIIDGKSYPGYSIEKFEENHTNIESKISDLKNILLKYFPSVKPHPQLYDLIEQLYILQAEFENHAYLEDRLLVPHVEYLEKLKKPV
ncbi:MAG: hemerythrin domain-containing protein [Bacteroidales bacterium]|jgi:regulator of cell morphogenesis and NO signaling|nr:hemerythrin domain-containing protein [Bacteroidales bacterium]